MGKSTISMAIFNSYVSLPEGLPMILLQARAPFFIYCTHGMISWDDQHFFGMMGEDHQAVDRLSELGSWVQEKIAYVARVRLGILILGRECTL